jgi:hypothetical protein
MKLKNGPAGMPAILVVSHWHNGLSRGGEKGEGGLKEKGKG